MLVSARCRRDASGLVRVDRRMFSSNWRETPVDQQGVKSGGQGAELSQLKDAAVNESSQKGAEFFCQWGVYNEIRATRRRRPRDR